MVGYHALHDSHATQFRYAVPLTTPDTLYLSIQARLDEMQAQYDRLLTEVEGAKSAAREEAIRALDAGEPPKSPTPAAQE